MTASTNDPQRLAERVVEGMMASDALSRWLGLEVVAVAPRHATCRMTVRPEMVNGFGVAHGGIVVAEGACDGASGLFRSHTNEGDDGLVPHLGASVGERPLELGRGPPIAELPERRERHLPHERVVVLDRHEQLRERRDRLRVGERRGRPRPNCRVGVAEGLLEGRDAPRADGLVDAPREVTAELFARLGASLHAGAHDVA